jgi:hypothetical protein
MARRNILMLRLNVVLVFLCGGVIRGMSLEFLSQGRSLKCLYHEILYDRYAHYC